jgi:hypothetical protein
MKDERNTGKLTTTLCWSTAVLWTAPDGRAFMKGSGTGGFNIAIVQNPTVSLADRRGDHPTNNSRARWPRTDIPTEES